MTDPAKLKTKEEILSYYYVVVVDRYLSLFGMTRDSATHLLIDPDRFFEQLKYDEKVELIKELKTKICPVIPSFNNFMEARANSDGVSVYNISSHEQKDRLEIIEALKLLHGPEGVTFNNSWTKAMFHK